MDQLERSFQEEQSGIEASIRAARNAKPSFTPQGYCLSCYEDVTEGKLYCDSKCADEHQHKLSLTDRRH